MNLVYRSLLSLAIFATAFPLAIWAGRPGLSKRSTKRFTNPQGLSPRQASTSELPISEATVTAFNNPRVTLATVTITSLSSEQTPTITNGIGLVPDTTGSIITTLETEGNPPVLPFPTSIPTVTESTLLPSETLAPFTNFTRSTGPIIVTETIVLPLTTYTTVVETAATLSIPVPTVISVTAVTVLNTTYTSDGITLTSSSAGLTVAEQTVTVLSETVLTASSVVTGTVNTTITGGALPTTQSTAAPDCHFNLLCDAQDALQPIAVGSPPAKIPLVGGHPVPQRGVTGMTGPIETNKFYANFFLGSQGSSAFVMPYSLVWSKGSGNAQSWGMAVSHIEDRQKVFGPPNTAIPGSPASYYINPVGIQSVVLSAAELDKDTTLTSDSLEAFSANIKLSPTVDSPSSVTFPVVQGMGFVTAIYNGLQVEIESSVFFRSIASLQSPRSGLFKYRIVLEDDTVWLLYAAPNGGLDPNFQLVSSTLLQGIPLWSGTIQVAKLPDNVSDTMYDNAAGAYASSGTVAARTQGALGEYSLSWTKSGPFASTADLLMFALPHHVESFDAATAGKKTSLTLQTPTKGLATAVVADYWVMTEPELPANLGFAPWRPGGESVSKLSAAAVNAIQTVAAIEASQDVSAQTNLNSMYYSGKGLSKFAQLAYTMNELSEQKGLASALLAELKDAFAVFTENRQQFPLYYDTDWKGIVSSAAYVTGDSGQDFGNSYYNDHHFHYGYFIHAAAIIGYLDPSWLTRNQDYVNVLVRDVANPSTLDQYFPIFRSFDWYNGHSWAKGLFESGDGKDEESSSEDAMFAYALKLWGQTTGDASMEARGNLMLSVLTRSFRNYFHMQSSNQNHPPSFIGNKVTGILFENKADHVTYFGTNIEYVQGIHMLPLMPFSTLTRNETFVQEEWDLYFSDGSVDPARNVQGGWKGVLFANLALLNPVASYNFFTQPNFDASWLDGGATRSWYIAFAAGLGGA